MEGSGSPFRPRVDTLGYGKAALTGSPRRITMFHVKHPQNEKPLPKEGL